MTAPTLTVQIQGAGNVSADMLNTYEQTCDIFSQMRAFIGTTGVQIFARGAAAVNDGLGGMFYWNGSSVAADDNANVIAPTGAATGRWLRLSSLALDLSSLTNDATGGDVADSVPFIDASAANASKKVTVANFLGNALNTATADATPDVADLLLTRDASAAAIRSATIGNFYKSINGLTEDTAPAVGDFFPSYDISAVAARKVSLTTLGATQAQMEAVAALTAFSTPGRQHFHPGHPKATVHFGITGNILDDFGVASITDVGVGLATATLDTAVSNTDTMKVHINVEATISATLGGYTTHVTSLTTTTIALTGQSPENDSLSDPTSWFLTVFGDYP